MEPAKAATTGSKQSPPLPTNQTVNNDDHLMHTMSRMSLNAAPPPPAEHPSSSGMATGQETIKSYPSNMTTPPRSSAAPLRRAPSAGSLGIHDRPSPPALQRKTSLSSIKSSGGVTPPRSPAGRRSSSYFHNLSMGDRSSLPPPAEEPPPPPPATAASVARDFFRRELEVKHGTSEVTRDSKTVVILQDACYGHRYSRPKTTRSALSTIVERPERIHASLLGVASAYVRLGGRHIGGKAPPSPHTDPVSLPAAPFKILKTSRAVSLGSPAATAVHGGKWMGELTTLCEEAETKLATNGKELTRRSLSQENEPPDDDEKTTLHEGDLYLCAESLAALEGALGGVCTGVDAVCGERGARRSFVCIRPPGHHCAAHLPSGFCWLNNVHVGIQHGIMHHGLTHAAIIDFDLHHGDGSQSITWAHNARIAAMPKNTPLTKKVPIGYFSIHDINSYPCEEGDEEKVRNASVCIENAHGQSIWNVHLQSWKTTAEFWSLYEGQYLILLAKARKFLRAHSERLRQAPTHPRPKGVIFLSAGFDASEWEGAGMQRHQVNVPTDFYARFTRDVIAMAEEPDLGVDGRIISVLEGGYSDRALMSGVLSHLSGMAGHEDVHQQGFTQRPILQDQNGGIGNAANVTPLQQGVPAVNGQLVQPYDSVWWAPSALEEIEQLVNPTAQQAVTKGQRGKVQPTFTSPTESFIAKVVPGSQGRRSFSGSNRPASVSLTRGPPGPPGPPPDVDWATAAHELCKLLVPTDRETRSCRPEDLNAEATRKRRDRVSNIGLPAESIVPDVKQMPVREKRTRAAKPPVPAEEIRKAPSRASRRKTMADVSILNEDTTEGATEQSGPQKMPARRRSSVASSIGSMSTLNTSKASDFTLQSPTEGIKSAAASQVRKSKGPVVPLSEAPKNRPAKKATTTSKIPSNVPSTTNGDPARPSSANNTQPPPINGTKEAGSRDVDQLAAGLKGMSIKLHVPPREEYEARQQQKPKPAPRGRPPKAPVPKATRPKSPTKNKVKPPTQTLPSGPAMTKAKATDVAPSDSALEVTSTAESQAAFQIAASHPPVKVASTAQLVPNMSALSDNSSLPSTIPQPDSTPMDLDVQEAKPPPTSSIPSSSAVPSRPENVPIKPETVPFKPNTPVTVKRMSKSDLPVFTSTSPIPFGRPQSKDGTINATMSANNVNLNGGTIENAKTIHSNHHQSDNVPANPLPRPSAGARRISGAHGMQPPAPPQTSNAASKAESGKDSNLSATTDKSIWDIPDTPQPPLRES